MKRPAFQFYPADWRKDPALSACSLAARGLWIELMCIAHESDDYGVLSINGKPMTEAQIARVVGESPKELAKLLAELEQAGVFSRNEEGAIFSRRMVKDETVRNARAAGGKEGAEHGNKGASYGALGGRPKGGKKTPLTDEQYPPPSSSSSSSVSLSSANAEEVASKLPPCPHQEVISLYHETLPMLPAVREWNETRQGYLRSRWKSHASLDYWQKFFTYVAESEFLTGRAEGRNGSPPFVADLEWLIRPNNFVKVIEGKYHKGAE